MLKSILSVIAGYVVMIILIMAMFAVFAAVAPDTFGPGAKLAPGVLLLLVILAFGLAAAMAGGWTTRRLAPRANARHVAALAAVVVVMGVVSYFVPSEPAAPGWYKAALVVIGGAGVLIGGRA